MGRNPYRDKFYAAIRDFQQNNKAIGLTQTTIDNYDRALQNFWNFMEAQDGTWDSDPTFIDLRLWRDKLLETMKPSSVKQYLVRLHTFFEWASDEEMGEARYYDRNPVAGSLYPDTTKEDARPYDIILPDDKVQLLFRNEIPKGKGCRAALWPRNYAICILILTTGIRTSELLDLRLCDLDFENRELTVERGKGNKYRVVDLSEIAITALELYLKSGYRPESLSDTDYLFGNMGKVNAKGKRKVWQRGDRSWLSAVIERHVFAVTEVHNVRGHDLRHICSRLDLNSGMGLEELQAKLGHSNMSTTQIYSGKLMARRGRKSAQSVYQVRDLWANLNRTALHPDRG